MRHAVSNLNAALSNFNDNNQDQETRQLNYRRMIFDEANKDALLSETGAEIA